MLIGYIREGYANTIIHFINLINDGKFLIVLKFMIIRKNFHLSINNLLLAFLMTMKKRLRLKYQIKVGLNLQKVDFKFL